MSLMVKGSVSILFLMGLALGLDDGESTSNGISTKVTRSTVTETNSGTLQPSIYFFLNEGSIRRCTVCWEVTSYVGVLTPDNGRWVVNIFLKL